MTRKWKAFSSSSNLFKLSKPLKVQLLTEHRQPMGEILLVIYSCPYSPPLQVSVIHSSRDALNFLSVLRFQFRQFIGLPFRIRAPFLEWKLEENEEVTIKESVGTMLLCWHARFFLKKQIASIIKQSVFWVFVFQQSCVSEAMKAMGRATSCQLSAYPASILEWIGSAGLGIKWLVDGGWVFGPLGREAIWNSSRSQKSWNSLYQGTASR